VQITVCDCDSSFPVIFLTFLLAERGWGLLHWRYYLILLIDVSNLQASLLWVFPDNPFFGRGVGIQDPTITLRPGLSEGHAVQEVRIVTVAKSCPRALIVA